MARKILKHIKCIEMPLISWWARNFPHFIEAQGSLPRSQEPAICLYRSQVNPDHASTCFLIHFNIIFLLTLSSSKWSTPSPQKSRMNLPNTCHMSRPSYSSWSDHPKNIWWVHTIKLLIMQSSPVLCYLLPLSAQISSLTPSDVVTARVRWSLPNFNFRRCFQSSFYAQGLWCVGSQIGMILVGGGRGATWQCLIQ
jgi:hypothetical protein